MAYRYKQGFFRPQYPEKYVGNPNEITYRSGLELKAMIFFDRNPNVLNWSSEELIVPYLSPADNRMHKYYPDFVIKMIGKDKKEHTLMIEIKPDHQTKAPKFSKRKKATTMLKEAHTWEINQAKWEAAVEFCQRNNWEFKIITEKHING